MTALSVLPIVLSVVALTIALLGFRDTRKRDKRDTLLKILESLSSEDRQHGRQLMFEKVSDAASVDSLTRDEYRLINRALFTYEAVGLYVRRGYVNEDDVMEMWAVSIRRAWVRGAPFVQHRQKYQGTAIWPNYRHLAERAELYLTRHQIDIDPEALEPPDTSPNVF